MNPRPTAPSALDDVAVAGVGVGVGVGEGPRRVSAPRKVLYGTFMRSLFADSARAEQLVRSSTWTRPPASPGYAASPPSAAEPAPGERRQAIVNGSASKVWCRQSAREACSG